MGQGHAERFDRPTVCHHVTLIPRQDFTGIVVLSDRGAVDESRVVPPRHLGLDYVLGPEISLMFEVERGRVYQAWAEWLVDERSDLYCVLRLENTPSGWMLLPRRRAEWRRGELLGLGPLLPKGGRPGSLVRVTPTKKQRELVRWDDILPRIPRMLDAFVETATPEQREFLLRLGIGKLRTRRGQRVSFDLARAKELRASGMTSEEAAAAVNTSVRTLYRVLQRERQREMPWRES